MPLVRIDLNQKLYNDLRDEIGLAVHQAQIDTIKIPVDDKFQVFTPHDEGDFKFDPHYNNVHRQSLVVIQITLVQLYSVKTKRSLYAAVVEALAKLGIRPEDILISLVENTYEDWYGGAL
jgi:Tautomerase enzyme